MAHGRASREAWHGRCDRLPLCRIGLRPGCNGHHGVISALQETCLEVGGRARFLSFVLSCGHAIGVVALGSNEH